MPHDNRSKFAIIEFAQTYNENSKFTYEFKRLKRRDESQLGQLDRNGIPELKTLMVHPLRTSAVEAVNCIMFGKPSIDHSPGKHLISTVENIQCC